VSLSHVPRALYATFGSQQQGDELRASGKPIFLYGRKGEPLSPDNMQRLQTGSRKELEAWVWKNVEVPVLFWNRHNHPIQIYWIHGSRAHIKDTLQPGAQAWHTSMLTYVLPHSSIPPTPSLLSHLALLTCILSSAY